MLRHEDKRWLAETLNHCLDGPEAKDAREQKLLKGFSMLIKLMAENMESALKEAWVLWEIEPTSPELRKKFNALGACLSGLKRYCEDTVARKQE